MSPYVNAFYKDSLTINAQFVSVDLCLPVCISVFDEGRADGLPDATDEAKKQWEEFKDKWAPTNLCSK